MSGQPISALDGRWELARVSGLLPPLGFLHKRIEGGRGATRLGSVLRLPLRVRQGPAGPELVYAGPLSFVRDRLRRGGDGWVGETFVLGLRVGRFRMTRPAAGAGSPVTPGARPPARGDRSGPAAGA